VELRGKLDLFVSSLLINLSQFLSPWTWAKFELNYVKSSCCLLLLFCLDIASLLYNSFLLQVLSYCQVSQTSISGIIIDIIAYRFRTIVVSEPQLLQQLVSEVNVDERRYVEDRKLYVKVQDREIQWQRKLWFMTKEGKGVAHAIGSSQDLAGKVSKTCKYIR